MIRYLSLFFLLVQILLHAEERKEFKIGALAKRGAEITLTRWQPTAEYLEQVLPHYRFTIVPIGFDDIQESVAQKKIDFVIANSAYYIDLEMNYGVHRIATLKNVYKCKKCAALFGGVIFTKAGRDDIDTLNDIKGKTFAAVDPQSFGGWHAALYEFVKQGIDPEEDFADLAFAGTHDGAVYAVLNGEADAGTARTETIEAMEQEGKINRASLKIINQQKTQDNQRLLSTTLYPEWPFAKLDHISNAVAEEIMLALIAMPEHSAAAQKAGISGWTIPQNYQPIHECLKAIRVGPYKDFGKITLEDAVRNYWSPSARWPSRCISRA
jgi:phosphate/phosphite/phosphonate ABC transporter binding protein